MELLAPAGSKEALIAAVENGADSVYLGGAKFGARAFANNFSQEELLWAIEYCHMHNVKVYVTVNTLVHQHEIEEAMEFLWFLYTAGVDAVIVQDLGLASLAKDILPELVIHASTQMTIHNPNDLKLLEELNIKRVVLARELSLAEIKRMAKQTSIELEVFAHGALCFSYSGQCLFSSIVGGRSGNRGKCAQPCRLQYQLLNQDLNTKIPTQGGYLLSTKDLNVVTQLKELKESGVSCLKIEGRMKRPEYVALVTKTYRTALNTGEIDHLTLEKVFNRGYTTGFISGKHQRTLSLTSPTNQGFEVGQVVSRKKNHVFIKLKHKVNEGDGLELTDASGKSIGVIVSGDNFLPDMMLKLYIKTGIKVGSAVYLTSDRELLATAQQTYLSVEDAKKMPSCMLHCVWEIRSG